jgi:hypothetical protein
VTADYTMANGVVAEIWGLPHGGRDDAWQRAKFPDGRRRRRHAVDERAHHRWRSAGFNYNRGRANEIASALLCHDFLASATS